MGKEEIVLLPLSKIVPDVTQPRQEFEPHYLNQLKKSIQQKGILSPLVVEERKDGNYLLIDGERRFRCATMLGLERTPVRIEKPMDDLQRLVLRFHLQEHHRSWSLFDKARAIKAMLDTQEMVVTEVAELLGIQGKSVQAYLNLLSLSKRSQELAITKRIPFSYLNRTAHILKKLRPLNLLSKKEILEQAIIDKVERGVVDNVLDMTGYSVAIEKGGQEIVDNIIKIKNYTSEQALVDSKAGNERAYTKLMNNLSFIETRVSNAIENSIFKLLDADGYRDITRFIKKLEKFIKLSKHE